MRPREEIESDWQSASAGYDSKFLLEVLLDIRQLLIKLNLTKNESQQMHHSRQSNKRPGDESAA